MLTAMRLYISSPQGTNTNLGRTLERVARLYHKGVLDDASTVWINSDSKAAAFWTLSSRPACILWITAPSSGTVRLTKDRIRWATTYNASGKNPDFDVHLSTLPVESIRHVTVVVDHGHPTEPVQVLDGADSVQMVDGFYQGSDAAVIDLKNFVPTPRDHTPAPATYATSLAFVHGMNLLTTGMGRKETADFVENIELHGIDLPPEVLNHLVNSMLIFEAMAKTVVEDLSKNQLT